MISHIYLHRAPRSRCKAPLASRRVERAADAGGVRRRLFVGCRCGAALFVGVCVERGDSGHRWGTDWEF